MNKVIEEFLDDTTPADIEECGNDDEKEKTAEKIKKVYFTETLKTMKKKLIGITQIR